MKNSTRFGCIVAIAVFLLAQVLLEQDVHGQPPQNPQDSLSAARVQQAIKDGVRYLFNSQREAKWAGQDGYGCGQTALVTLALLNCGVPPNDPAIRKSMKYLRGVTPTKVYEGSIQTMVFCLADPKQDMPLIERNAKWLVKIQLKGEGSKGAWSYGEDFGPDESCSQFALLALWEAQRVGVAVPRETLADAKAFWIARQQRDNGWLYKQDASSTGSMTCAGVASLIIADDALAIADAKIENNTIHCCGADNATSPVDRGLQWLSTRFSISQNPEARGNGAGWHFYYLYGLERVSRLSGQRLIGNHDWYREGCSVLLERQNRTSGFFASGSPGETDPITSTALALLFLSKGKRQIVFGRLDYRENENAISSWNTHRRAIQNLTGHIEQAWKRDLAWQTVNFRTAQLKDLLECPVLYINGTGKLQFTKEQKKMLKEYVEQGNFIFAEACDGNDCHGQEFDESFRALVEELFEQPLRKLPLDHPIWNAEARIMPQALPDGFWLYGLEQCCRTSIVYSPISLSCRWELHRAVGNRPNWPEGVRNDIENATKIGINVAAYATGRELKEKLDAVQIFEPIADVTPVQRGTLVLPKLQHSGGSDDAPRAITNLLNMMKKDVPTSISSQPIMISPIDKELEKYPLVYIHGRRQFAFSLDQRAALRRYFENGGFLLGDSICASSEFWESLRNELAAILPEATLKVVPPDHPMLTPKYQGYDVRRVKLLDPVPSDGKSVQVQKREGAPVLEMLVYKDRVVAVISKFDISCALESRGTTQCRGYPTQDAGRIAINMILFAMLQ